MIMDPGSRDDLNFGGQLSTPNPPTPPMINFSHHHRQPQLQFFPSYGLHSYNPPVSSNPSVPMTMPGWTTPSPSSTTTELDGAEDSSEAVADDPVLAYINQFLLEDEDEESYSVSSVSVEDSALLAVEKPFIDILKSAKPITFTAQAYEVKSWITDRCDSTGGGGFHDVATSDQNNSPLPCEMVKKGSVGTAHKVRKNPHDDDLELEERKSKQSSLCEEETVREMFDNVLLCTDETSCEFLSPLPANAQIIGQYVKGSGNRRGRRKGRSGAGPEEESVDLTTLLIHCAQAAAIDDHRNSNELLKQIRKYSSASGDAGQRLAHYFANGLEARLAGTGSSIYRSLAAKRTFTGDILKAFSLYVKACPFKTISHYFANMSILNACKSVTKLHIIDYGVQYGFQWPVIMQRFSKRCGGPPSIRITGIDFPLPGFRPAERIEATGRRLEEYARMFKIPFEYRAIAAKWDTIQVEDLKIKSDEFLVVNCLYRMRNMMDETATDDSPRTRVLNTIRELNPHLFVHGILNGTYNAPFFVTRFKEAMFFFSSAFDMLETNASRMDEHRLLIEREFFGREALNVIACEGTERIERPETYKQWQMRNLRAGFRQLPLNEDIMKRARYRATKRYHRDFLVDEDNKWMLQGWKGRVMFALSTWTS